MIPVFCDLRSTSEKNSKMILLESPSSRKITSKMEVAPDKLLTLLSLLKVATLFKQLWSKTAKMPIHIL